MKKFFAVLIFSALVLLPLAGQSVNYKISEVTVFTDRAMVTRTAEVNLVKGEQVLVFASMPLQLNPDSLQASGRGNLVLKDVKLASKQLAQEDGSRTAALLAEKKNWEDQVKILNDANTEAESEKRFLEGIVKKLTTATEAETVMDPDKWIKMVAFYRDRLSKLNSELRKNRDSLLTAQNEISRINRELQILGGNTAKAQKEFQLTVEAAAAGPAFIELSYMVYGPSWQADYTLRADGTAGTAGLTYNALVKQSTGEDWIDAVIKLSTASPQVSGNMPELSPWFIYPYKPPVYSQNELKKERAVPMAAKSMAFEEAGADMYAELPELEYQTARAVSSTASVLFEPSGRNTVKSDNQEYKLTIGLVKLNAEYRYSAVPRLSNYMYLKAEVTNNSDFPLLPGTSHIFLDGSFVADAQIGDIAAGEKFEAALGIDKSISVSRKRISRMEDKSGVVAKKVKYLYEYVIEVKNNKSVPVNVSILDQLPVSQHADISVKLEKPVYTGDTAALKKKDYDIFEWTLSLKPGESAKIPIVYSVMYPKGMNVQGLE